MGSAPSKKDFQILFVNSCYEAVVNVVKISSNVLKPAFTVDCDVNRDFVD